MRENVILSERAQSLKNVGHLSYALHAIVAVGAVIPGVQASVALLLVAFVIDLAKRGQAAQTWQESHFAWRIHTVVWVAVLYLLTAPLWLLLLAPGWIAWGVISIWFLYRIVKGWMNFNDNRPMS
jgi:uncharacterized membrane protein